MNDAIWEKWIHNWRWILEIAEKQGWDTAPLEIKPKVSKNDVVELEKVLDIVYPKDFKDTLIKYSSGVNLFWKMKQSYTAQGDFKDIFGAADIVFLWDFESLQVVFENYQTYFCRNCDEYDAKNYYIPFTEFENGDILLFDTEGRVIFQDAHDDGIINGKKLADNFIEFISNWSNLGCFQPEDDSLAVFYDTEKQKLMDCSPKIDAWKNQCQQAIE